MCEDRADSLVKGTDTMDVWFDSGSSWAGVVKARTASIVVFTPQF